MCARRDEQQAIVVQLPLFQLAIGHNTDWQMSAQQRGKRTVDGVEDFFPGERLVGQIVVTRIFTIVDRGPAERSLSRECRGDAISKCDGVLE